MKRRQFSRALLSTPAAWWCCPTGALAQAPTPAAFKPVDGTHYVRLGQPVPTGTAGKVEVIEFFWYGCPHCFSFESALDPWVKQLPADVNFQRMPVAFSTEPFGSHQRLFYALETLGVLAALHRKVFYAIHKERLRLDKPAEIVAFMVRQGLDATTFAQAFESPAVRAKARRATQVADAYKIDGVPALGVQGRYYTSVSLAGSPDRALAVTNFLLQRVRGGA